MYSLISKKLKKIFEEQLSHFHSMFTPLMLIDSQYISVASTKLNIYTTKQAMYQYQDI